VRAEPSAEDLQQGLAAVKRAGYDYGELRLSSITQLSDEDFNDVRETVEKAPIEVLSFNIFLPSSVPVTGPDVVIEDIDAYLRKSLTRARELGGSCVVFGSSRSRNVPQGYDRRKAEKQIDDFLKRCEEYAAPLGVTIAIEPLNRKESNIINSVAEGLKIAERLDLSHIAVLADCYHMFQEGESLDILQKAKDRLAHVHIADGDRYFPGHSPSGGMDFGAFFDALKKCGYEGLVSTEARFDDFDNEGPLSNAFVRDIWD
jgi:sugar phosphate isomerase/epimerase